MHPQNIEDDANRIVEIKYTNHRGEFKSYKIIPHNIHFGSTDLYPADQWLMDATDVQRNVFRTFAMKNIASWSLV